MEALAAELYAAGDLMGLLTVDPETWFGGDADGGLSAEDIDTLIKQRNVAKSERDFEKADAIREQLTAAGITIQDARDGTTWRRSG